MKKIGIIGFGFVGQAVYSCIKDKPKVIIYDKYKNIGYIKDIIETDVAFICVSTPTNKGLQSGLEIKEVLNKLTELNYNGIVVIKSTVLNCNIKGYIDKLKIVFNPEFLNQNTANKDFYNQNFVIIGGRADYAYSIKELYENYFNINPNAQYEIMDVETAVNIKYIHNIYHAYKVLFWHYVQDVTGNQRKIFDIYSKITGNTHEMAKLCCDGKWGYGGACFPKDVTAFHSENTHELTKFMIDLNLFYRPDEMNDVL